MTAINDVITKIHEFIMKADISENVIDKLKYKNLELIKIETDLWDYKLELSAGKVGLAELVRDILGFYNSYGGYLIFGVNDSGIIVGNKSDISQQTVRQSIKTYSGEDIAVTVRDINIKNNYCDAKITIILIPKRQEISHPATIQKQGPEIQGNRPLFKPGDIFLRSLDNTTSVRGPDDIRFLIGPRHHPYANHQHLLGKTKTVVTTDNLPDRSIIFTEFFGRLDIKNNLWSWIADPRSKYKIIAGPGGVGKTSTAYSFCEEISNESPLSITKIIWISAKKEQFSGIDDKKVSMPYRNGSREYGQSFSDYNGMLDAISFHLPITDEEWEDTDTTYKSDIIYDNLKEFHILIVIDDLDSLSTDDQRSAITFAIGATTSKSKILFTTRKNYIAPAAAVFEMGGLVESDFHAYIDHLQEKYSRSLTKTEQESLFKTTSGSPLFIDSIFRLLRLGTKFSDAISRWKESDGEAARSACFRNEINQLTFHTKRILFAISLFGADGSAISEIKHVTETEIQEVESAITELGRLFLLKSKQIGSEARFEVAGNLIRILQEIKKDAIPNHSELTRRAALLRKSGNDGKTRGQSKEVGLLIRLATTQLGHGSAEVAVKTIEDSLKDHRDSADIWMVYARCLSACKPVDVTKTHNAFEKSFKKGKREPQLFIKWLDFELTHGNYNAAVHVAEKGEREMHDTNWDWASKVSAAYYNRGIDRSLRLESLDALSDLKIASRKINFAIKKCGHSRKSNFILISNRINDSIWNIIHNSHSVSPNDKFDLIKKCIINGDHRDLQLDRILLIIMESMQNRQFTETQRDLIKSWIDFALSIAEQKNNSNQIEAITSHLHNLNESL